MASGQAWRNILLFSALLSSAIAGRLDTVARNRGFHPNLKKALEARRLAPSDERASAKYRYRNAKTEPFFVESLPEVPQSYMTEMYSGLMPIHEDEPDRALFFVFQPRIGGPPVDEVTIWMNGGPGCSSLEGFLQENGWIQWVYGQYSPTTNMYSWPNLTNVLWVEQPVGTGFSIGKPNATNEEDIASDFIKFFKNFEQTFGIKNYKIYITGESYAGRYVPYISAAMLDQNDTCYYDVQGALMYDPCIGAFDAQDNMYTLEFAQENNNILNFNESFMSYLEERDESCGFRGFKDQYMQFPPVGYQPPLAEPDPMGNCSSWNDAYNAAFATNPCFNVYMLGFTCPLDADPLGYPTDLQYQYRGEPVYFNRSDVKEAMHAPDIPWLECAAHSVFKGKGGGAYIDASPGSGGPEGYGDLSPDPIQGVLPQVIEKTNRVLIANGKLDMDILTNATLIAIQNMVSDLLPRPAVSSFGGNTLIIVVKTWNGLMGFQTGPNTWEDIDIRLPDLQYQSTFVASGFGGLDRYQGIMGKQHYERGLMFCETYMSGHMEPQFQPRSSYRHLQWVLGRIDKI